ncbi:MAG: hypothetical protein ACI9R3_006562, partial [Verrucomicrobiales bacterium]
RRDLIRRSYFNIIGLPPTFEEVQRFVNDPDPKAYEKLVDRLLDSQHYGERWARHWLDVVHFGETHGYDKDKPRPNAWPYRDYVIRSFNDDKPYERFVKEQIAGDVLWPNTEDGIVATGFIAAGPWDFIGHAEVPEEKVDGKVARHLDRDDMVATTMNTFTSLTVQCAQCHDHRRDPVTMDDYYSLQAVFAALDRTDRDYDTDPEVAAQRTALNHQISGTKLKITTVNEKIEAAKTEPIRQADQELTQLEKLLSETHAKGSERLGYHSLVATSQETEKWVQIDLGEARQLEKIGIFGAVEYGFDDFGFPHRFRVEASLDESFENATTIASYEAEDFPRPGATPVILDVNQVIARYVRVTASRLWSRRMKGNQPSQDWIFALSEVVAMTDGSAIKPVAVQALDSIDSPPRWSKDNLIDDTFGGDSRDTFLAWHQKDVSAQLENYEAKKTLRDSMLKDVAEEALDTLARHQKSLEALQSKLTALPAPGRVYAGTIHTGSGAFAGRGHARGVPREIFVLHRGDVTQPLTPVRPGTVPEIVSSIPDRFLLPEDHSEGDRRTALAGWITHPDNKLTWRSIVNRVWQYHFGRGLVDTPNDFGRIGGQPSHPALLDWLAVEFRDNGGSLKYLHRLILNSATYRQSSAHDEEMAKIDTSNQFLWRQNRRRIEAEVVRDAVLALSGKLDLTMGGPSFQDFVIEQPDHSPHYQYHLSDPDDPSIHRRSIYRFTVRSQPQPFMDALDCADPSQLVDKRGETITALQALAMLNNAFLLRMSEHFADRIKNDVSPVTTAFHWALARPPSAEEIQSLNDYAEKHGHAAMCRLILNLNEFSFID